jgi:ribokinase
MGSAVSEPIDGGKSTCQAVAAARQGAAVTLISVLGTDDRGRWWRGFLDAEGIDTRWLSTFEGSTDLGIVMLPPSRAPAIVSVAALSRHLDAALANAAGAVIRDASMVICSLECPHETVETAFRIARQSGVRTILNPSPVSGVGPALLGLADLIVANEHEAQEIAGHEGAPGELASALARRWSPATIIVTAGADGAHLARGADAPIHVPAPSVVPVDTTGAGDALIGALAAGLQAGADMEEALRRAVRVASQSVLAAGSIASYPRSGDLVGEPSARAG